MSVQPCMTREENTITAAGLRNRSVDIKLSQVRELLITQLVKAERGKQSSGTSWHFLLVCVWICIRYVLGGGGCGGAALWWWPVWYLHHRLRHSQRHSHRSGMWSGSSPTTSIKDGIVLQLCKCYRTEYCSPQRVHPLDPMRLPE